MPTKIPYADESWNPVVGCTKIKSGCKNCWAERLHDKRHLAWLAKLTDWTTCPKQYWLPFSEVQLLPDRLKQPLHWRKPRTIFVNSMSDTFHENVPAEFINRILEVVWKCPQHTFLFFTRRFVRAGFRDVWPENLRLYFSASTQAEVDEAWKYLEPIPAAVKGLSLEPLLDSLYEVPPVDSVIVGCESGPEDKRRMCLEHWIEGVVTLCRRNNTLVYVKQIMVDGKVCSDMSRFPRDLQIREMPK